MVITELTPCAPAEKLEKPAKTPPFTVDAQFTFNPLAQWQALGHTLFNAQKQVLEGLAKVCLYQGGYACGKTHAAVLFGLQQAFKQPGTQGLVLAQHSATLLDSMMPDYNRLLQQLGLINGQHYVVRKTARCIVLKNGSVIQFRTARQQWHMLNCDWAQVERLDEIKNPDTFNTLLARLNKPGATVLATALPAANHWMNTLFGPVFDADNTLLIPHKNLFTRVIGQTADNTTLDPSYTAILQAVLTPVKQASLLNGQTPTDAMQTAKLPALSHKNDSPSPDVDDTLFSIAEDSLWLTPKRFTAKRVKDSVLNNNHNPTESPDASNKLFKYW